MPYDARHARRPSRMPRRCSRASQRPRHASLGGWNDAWTAICPPAASAARRARLLDKQALTSVTFRSTNEEQSVTTMANQKFVSCLRVSTAKQGESGLGLEAQRAAVLDYLNGGRGTLVAEFVETESGADNERPKLAAAMATARAHGARLVIAKLDRLSRDAAFLLGLQRAGVRFVAADMPEANEMVVGIMAVVAEAERKMISKRTKDALAAAKARGVKLGGFRGYVPTADDNAAAGRAKAAKANAKAADLKPIFDRIGSDGSLSLRQMAAMLTVEGIPTPAGGAKWTAMQVARVRARLSPTS